MKTRSPISLTAA